jgi:molybdopterin/thiamine biosynthesis adenylyltransferase
MDDALNFSQQKRIFSASAAEPVTVIGVGSVGSQTVAMLAKIGVKTITVHDGDSVESHNIPMSAYRIKDLGVPKVRALAEIVAEQSGVRITAIQKMYAGEELRGAVVACVDSMEARKRVWEAVKNNPAVSILVDTRVAEELVSVFAVHPCDPDDVAYYEHFLSYDSGSAVRPLCGVHGIVYVGAMAAVTVCANLTLHWSKGRKKRHLKALVGELEFLEQ